MGNQLFHSVVVESNITVNVENSNIFYAKKTHLIADTEGHLGNLDVNEGVVHSSSLLHLVDVVNRMLLRGNE